MPDSSALASHLHEVALIDQHVHGCWRTTRNREHFENALNEANTAPLTTSGFDSQLGFAVRAHCAPVLGLAKHVEPDAYWDRRSALGEDGLARLLLPAAGVSDWLVDTGIPADIADVAGMAALSGDRVHEIVRLEEVAEQAARTPGDYATAFEDILQRRCATAVGTKSILAYRGGFRG